MNAPKPQPAKPKQKAAGKESVKIRNEEDGALTLIGSDQTTEKTFGTSNKTFAEGLTAQLIHIASHGKEIDERMSDFVFSILRGVEPRDEIEAMLATQMAAVHNATIKFARRLAQVETIPQQDSAERAFNKLARTYAAQMEALRKYRTGGQQNVTVKHVTVNEGGQAVVGFERHIERFKA